IKDMTGGFTAWRREVLEAIDVETVRSAGYAFQVEMKYRAWKKGFKYFEMPIVFVDRRLGQSKISSNIFIEAMWRVLQIRFLKF
ncbi:MAG: polyprenol monophosphomannose synthase, partial [Patescibacteria group bacterium]